MAVDRLTALPPSALPKEGTTIMTSTNVQPAPEATAQDWGNPAEWGSHAVGLKTGPAAEVSDSVGTLAEWNDAMWPSHS